ncbi:MAG: 6,7-dimethyl-8-ribityllumazine synthase [Pseudomonadota bacterium]
MNILVIDARYHTAVADALVDGATGALEKGGARFIRVSVPGVLEIPAAIAIAAQSGKPFDGYVALGCVLADSRIAGTLYEETVRALMHLGTTGLAIGNGIVMAADEGAALDQAQTMDVGGDAARASLSLVTFAQRIGLT